MYDSENRLAEVWTAANEPVAEYVYDWQGRRIAKLVYLAGPDWSGVYCYDGDDVIAEYNLAGDTRSY